MHRSVRTLVQADHLRTRLGKSALQPGDERLRLLKQYLEQSHSCSEESVLPDLERVENPGNLEEIKPHRPHSESKRDRRFAAKSFLSYLYI